MEIQAPEQVGLPASIDRSEFTMYVEREELYVNMLYLSLALLIAGVGFLKANISTIVGSLYGFGDSRRDSGFTIFYMGINMGAFLASIFCGYLGIVHGWKYGFGLAGAGMLLGLVIFLSCQSWLEGKAEPPSMEKLKEKVLFGLNVEWACYMVGFAIIALSMFLVMNEELVGGILGPIGLLMMLGLIGYAVTQLAGDERSRMLAAVYFVLAQIPFWALFEQAGSSLNLFTARLVDREMLGWSVPGPVFQSLNAGFIFIFAPLMAWLWVWLAKRQLNPSTPVKFALGVAMAGLGFLVLVAGMKGSGAVGFTPVIFIFLIYWIHTMGELMVSPVGLSVVTKLAPARIVGMTMGAWFLYSGLSNFLAGIIARTTGAETIGGQMTNVAAAKAGYIEVYSQVGYMALGISVLMLLVSPAISKMMRGAD
jgi:POT family proton-dependent oligopeptide transporter